MRFIRITRFVVKNISSVFVVFPNHLINCLVFLERNLITFSLIISLYFESILSPRLLAYHSSN